MASKSAEGKLSSLGVNNILVVRRAGNIACAENYFNGFNSIRVDYSTAAKEAKQMIAEAYKSGYYEIVVTDISINEASDGLGVLETAARHFAVPIVVQGVYTSDMLERAMDISINFIEGDQSISRFKRYKELSADGKADEDGIKKLVEEYHLLARVN